MKTLQTEERMEECDSRPAVRARAVHAGREKHHHAPLWLYATPAHAIRDVLHASNYLTIAEASGRLMVRSLGQQVATCHACLIPATDFPLACCQPAASNRSLKNTSIKEPRSQHVPSRLSLTYMLHPTSSLQPTGVQGVKVRSLRERRGDLGQGVEDSGARCPRCPR